VKNDLETRLESEIEFHNKKFGDRTSSTVHIYDLPKVAYRFYRGHIADLVKGKRVLEYGCGEDTYAMKLVKWGASEVVSIDISDVAVEKLAKRVEENGLSERITTRTMNAEDLDFESDSFDVIVGRAILHHLDLEKSYESIARVLKPEGHAIFLEPLGHNPVINIYRNRTPHLRTVDEHPLLRSDLRDMDRFFNTKKLEYFTFLSIGSLLFSKSARLFTFFRQSLDVADGLMFKLLPFTRSWAWTVGIVLANPVKSEISENHQN